MTSNISAKNKLLPLALGSIGVVYGDIGTSPLYAFRESLHTAASGGVPVAEAAAGLLSLLIWTLLVIVTFKYVFLLLRADNQGEGGILSLMALTDGLKAKTAWPLLLGAAGAALFYGDAAITPAISVLSAVEGLKLVSPASSTYVLPIAVAIIVLVFAVQYKGTEKIGRFFGPIMVLWFAVLAWGGLMHILERPDVFKYLNPYYAFHFVSSYGMTSFITIGAVFLAVTGAEALYADLGHFGRKPIRLAWISFVMPALALNYCGQAAMVMENPDAAENSFFMLYPDWAMLPVILLATFATVIASQAVISGAFSLTHQAIQLGLLPRMRIKYTSTEQAGQIYIAKVNWWLLAGVLALIAAFRTSGNLASAYGIAVTGTMVITALLLFQVMRRRWNWKLPLALLVISPLLLVDITFLASNLTKFFDGGFVPVFISALLIVLMLTWVKGVRELQRQTRTYVHTMDSMISELKHVNPAMVEGTAVYLNSTPEYAPSALLQNLKHNKVLHENNIILTMVFENRPHVPDMERARVQELYRNFTQVFLHYGFMDKPVVAKDLYQLKSHGLKLDMMNLSFFISRRKIVPSASFGMPTWQDKIFIRLTSSASDAADYFNLPPNRVVEIGQQMTV